MEKRILIASSYILLNFFFVKVNSFTAVFTQNSFLFLKSIENIFPLRSARNDDINALFTSSKKSLKYDGIGHIGVIVKDTIESKKFYMDMFNCIDVSHRRPSTLPFQGAFLQFGRTEVHLMELPNVDPITGRPEHGGRDRHAAFHVNDIDIIKEKYEEKGLPYTFSKSGRRALFCRDLDGNAFEFIEDPSL